MNDKEKAIEEMAKCYKCESYLYRWDVRNCQYLRDGKMCERYKIAEDIYNAGYRKIPDGAVVIPKKITEKTNAETLIKIAKYNERVRKETAREIFKAIKNAWETTYYEREFEERIDSLAKQFGVEVEE